MTRYFAGNTLASFSRSNLAVTESTTAGVFDSAYVDNSIYVVNSTLNIAKSAEFSAVGGIVWTHFEIDINHTDHVSGGPIWYNGATPVFRILRTDTGANYTYTPQVWIGGAWVATGGNFTLSAARYQWDIKIDLDAGSFEVWTNKITLASSASGWVGHQTTITQLWLLPESTGSNNTHYSQIMIADYDLRESKLFSLVINGNGTDVDGTGSYTDIDEIVTSDADAVVLSAVGDRKSFTTSGFALPSGFQIGALVVGARARVNDPVIVDGKIGCKSGAFYDVSAGENYDVVYSPGCYIIDSDPNTGNAWTEAGIDAAEIVLEAA